MLICLSGGTQGEEPPLQRPRGRSILCILDSREEKGLEKGEQGRGVTDEPMVTAHIRGYCTNWVLTLSFQESFPHFSYFGFFTLTSSSTFLPWSICLHLLCHHPHSPSCCHFSCNFQVGCSHKQRNLVLGCVRYYRI